MYGKIHQSFFGSSIVETDIETRFVFISMIVLSDAEGRIDVTRQSLARQINVPIETVDRALAVLGAPDELSRSPEHEGRRIVPIDPERTWGWIIINKAAYREASDEDRRRQAAERKRRQRERERAQREANLPPTTSLSDTDTDTDTDTESHARHAQSRKMRDRTAKRRGSPSFADDSREIQLARLLRDQRKAAGCLYTEPDLQRWAATFSDVLKIDGRDYELVERIIRHVTADERKRRYLRSPGALRGKWPDGSLKFDGWAEEVAATRDNGREHDFDQFNNIRRAQ